MGQKVIQWDRIILYLGILGILIYGIHTYKEVNKPIQNQDVIEKMKDSKDSLSDRKDKLIEDFNKKTKDRSTNQIKKNEEAIKEINNLPNASIHERDSLLSRLFSSEDSLSRRYRDFLESKARRKSSGNF